MIVVIIVISVIAVILAVTLGLVFGLKKKKTGGGSNGGGGGGNHGGGGGKPKPNSKSCNIDLSYNVLHPKFLEQIEIQDSCSPDVTTAADYINNKTDFCYPAPQNADALNDFINSFRVGNNNTYSTSFNGFCQPYKKVFSTLSPQPKNCNINLSYRYPKRTPSPSSKIYLEEIKIQDTCSPGVKTAADYINNKTDFCYPNKQNVSDLNDFINDFSKLTTDTNSLNINGTCKPYPNVFSKCCAREN